MLYDDCNIIQISKNITLGSVEKMLDIRYGSNWYGFCICLIQACPSRKIPVDKQSMQKISYSYLPIITIPNDLIKS